MKRCDHCFAANVWWRRRCRECRGLIHDPDFMAQRLLPTTRKDGVVIVEDYDGIRTERSPGNFW